MDDTKIYAVDFDGTLCENKWPEIGEPKWAVIRFCIMAKEKGHKLILWTCRNSEQVEKAVKWCKEKGLYFDAVNSNIPAEVEKWNNDPRKVGATWFIDDRNITLDEIEKCMEELDAKQEEVLSTFAT